jgi:formate dehydrogenase major subunit
VPGLGTTFGRGGATTAQQDLANADAILIMGSSMAENHPVGFQWVMEAREKNGATIIHVDPRFTRTSAMADIWVPLRAGSDIIFLGALINYVISNNKFFRDYVVPYTNAATIINEEYRDTEDLGGVFSGWDDDSKHYDPKTWRYQSTAPANYNEALHGAAGHDKRSAGGNNVGDPERDESLQHPRCVFQILKRHFARYTPELVEQACGVARDKFLKVAEAFTSASGPDKTAAICYAVGWTQHSKGVQIIRCGAILQALLGNIGRPGGGVLALRGHASIQGSTDIPTLYDILPGYLPMPFFDAAQNSLKDYIARHRSEKGLWYNTDKYIISLMKAWYGEAAQKENDFCFNLVPRLTGDHSHFGYWLQMADGGMDGLFVMGQNPAVGAPNGRLERKALAQLKWLVVRDMVETETASFWRNSPEVERGELRPETIGTEVFLFPAAGTAEKDGTFTNTQRLLQFREKAVDPPGDARSETWFIYHLGRRLKNKASGKAGKLYEPLQTIQWDYKTEGTIREPNVEQVLKEINGWDVETGKQLSGYKELKDDGSTACGCWIYSGVYPEDKGNIANKRAARDYLGHGWGFSWPNDVRIIYNRCSARPDGSPWSERKKLVWWDEQKQEWTGLDTPDFDKKKRPDYIPSKEAKGTDGLRGDHPFTLHGDGVAWLFVSSGLKDGPLPTHFEPLESPFHNTLYPAYDMNPAANKEIRSDNNYAYLADARFPYVLSTYRLTEHHTAGGMTRTLGHLAELQPELFCEVSPELAADVGLEHGGYACIYTPRAIIEARVLVTLRMRPLWVEGRTIHQVGIPYHWGTNGLVTGDSANDLLVISEEPNVRIMETKALVCDIVPGRRAKGADALKQWKSHLEKAA